MSPKAEIAECVYLAVYTTLNVTYIVTIYVVQVGVWGCLACGLTDLAEHQLEVCKLLC